MDHAEWVKRDLRALAESLGFRYTPLNEIENRLARARIAMKMNEIEALWVVEKMDYYYLSGTTQDGFLFVPLEGKPLLIVKRELERARIEAPLEEVVGFRSLRELPTVIQSHWGRLPKSVGVELDLLPVRDYVKYQDLFPGIRFVDSSPMLRDIRKIKSPFEIDLMKVSGEIGRRVYQEAKTILKEGMREIESGGFLEAVAKKYGHEGLLRVSQLRNLHLACVKRAKRRHCQPVGLSHGGTRTFAGLSCWGKLQGYESPRTDPGRLWDMLPWLPDRQDSNVFYW